ncbi:glycerophosphodiester phosphodiesterase [Metabacillus litoralis]|uniref:glycerophosphodiester phosphodiesterase n=1 Tax=Metabacillus litoralis TaxID=152268 RepID=UPI001CFD6FE5|nr:glycerophosphodiester phosphodiesterase family protein [Metabacillus litoralis]
MNPFKKFLKQKIKNKNKLLVVAHRGAAGYAPENTMAAFYKAKELKSDYIELDIQLTKDGQIVVIHDEKVDRTTNGIGEVKNFTYSELEKLDAGEWFHQKFKGEKVPTLKQVLLDFYGKIGILIEIKHPSIYPGIEQKLTKLIKEVIGEELEETQIIVQSFDFELLQRLNKISPSIPLGLLVKYRVHGISKAQLKDWTSVVKYINPNKSLITKKLVKKVHSYHVKVIPYTVKDKKTIKGLVNAGVDGIVTDYPDYVVEFNE